MNDDADLLRRYVKDGSQAAFAELVRRRIGLVYAIAWRRLYNAHSAQDVTQTVFTALARKAPQLMKHPTIVGWLYRSAHFATSDVLRITRRQQQREEDLLNMQPPDQHTPAPGWQELSPVVDDVLSAMSTVDRDAVLLRIVDEYSYSEIGRHLGTGESGARMRVERALEKMRQALARRGVVSTAAALGLAVGQQAGAAVPASLASAVATNAVTTAATGGGISAFATFMSSTKVGMTALGVVALAGIASSIFHHKAARQAESGLALVATERDQLRARLAAFDSAGQIVGTAISPTATPQPATNSAASQATSSSTTSAQRQAAWAVGSALNLALEKPDGKAAFVRQEVLRAEDRFRRLFDELQLSPEQRAAMQQLFQRYAEAKLDYYETVRAEGFGPMNPPQDPKVLLELLRMEDRLDATFARDLRHALGEEGASKFADFRRLVPVANVAEQLAGRLYTTKEPLTAVQATGLMAILQAHPYQPGTTTLPGSTFAGEALGLGSTNARSNLVHGDLMMPGLAWSAPITDAALDRAQAVLTPRQIAALRELQAQQAASYKLSPPAPKGATLEDALALHKKR